MNHKRTLLLALGLCAAAWAHAGERLFVQVPATIAPEARANPAVKSECRVDALVGRQVLQEVAQRWPGSQPAAVPAQAGKDKFVRLTLVSVFGVGGGAWSGPKSMTVRVDLTQSGKVLQTTTLTRTSSGGFWGATMGTCQIMERIAGTLGKDVAGWLPVPAGGSVPEQAPAAAAAPVLEATTPGNPVAP